MANKSKKDRHYHHELNFTKIAGRFFMVAVPAALVLGAVYVFTGMGPQKVNEVAPEESPSVKTPSRIDNSRQAGEEFAARAEEAIKAGLGTDKVAELLRKALESYQDVVTNPARTERDLKRTEVIGTQRDTLLSKPLLMLTKEAEKIALDFEAKGQDADALKEFQRAHYFQNSIQQQFPLSEDKNNERLASLQLKINSLTAKPRWEFSLKAERLSIAAMEVNDWDKARVHLDAALESQAEINRTYRGTTYASNSRLARLESELVSIKSGELYLSVSKKLDEARESEANGKNLIAAEAYQAASEYQLQLNQKYPQSRFASQDKVEEFEVSRQTAMSQDLSATLARKNLALDESLRVGRRVDYAELINDLQKNLQRLQEAFPRSRLVNPGLQQKASYLALILNDIEDIQKQSKGLLLPVSGHQVSLSRSEVSQAFYRRIMGENPSRRKGDMLPVDSVNHGQAVQFCERLSWVLGETISLPGEALFRAAVGDVAKYQDKNIWSTETARNMTQEVGISLPNAAGFFDLLGNVSEWLESPDASVADAPVIGGTCADPTLGVRELIPVRLPRTDSNRFLGFRFCNRGTATP